MRGAAGMSPPARGALFALALIAVFALASLAGAAIDPAVDDGSSHGASTHSHEEDR